MKKLIATILVAALILFGASYFFNGVAAAKAEADYVCQKERSEGVEEALRKFVL